MPRIYSSDDPWWYPRRPPPRIPDAVMRWFPEAEPPKSSRTTALDWVSYVVGLALAAGAYLTRSDFLFYAFVAVALFAIWRGFLCVVHEQQQADWANRKADPNDIPPDEHWQ